MSLHDISQTITPPVKTFPTYDAELLTGAEGQAHIVLQDKTYTLRITRAGKLILTK